MGCIGFLLALSLVIIGQMQGSSDVTRVFVQKGKDLHLNYTKAVVLNRGDSIGWKIKDVALVRFFSGDDPIVAVNYSGRITFTGENYSVILKNLREADSGIYTFSFSGEITKTLAINNVTVQDPVSPVKLKVDPRSVSTSPDSCNLTVTCSAEDSHINRTFRRQNQTFSQEEGEPSQVTPSGASLSFYLENGLIICNHSNQVNWTKANDTIDHLCLQDDGHKAKDNPHVVPIVIVFIIIILIVIVAVYLRRKIRRKRRNDNTIYDVAKLENILQPQPQPVDQNRIYDEPCVSPNTTYCLVGPHSRPVEPTDTPGNALPESLYAHVDKQTRA